VAPQTFATEEVDPEGDVDRITPFFALSNDHNLLK